MSENRELQGWEQIADYLGIGVRAAQKYEKLHALPVRRVPGTKGRIWADSADLDSWKAGLDAAGNLQTGIPLRNNAGLGQPPSASRWPRTLVLFGVLTATCAVAVSAWLRLTTLSPQAAQFKGSELIVFDHRATEVWRYSFSAPLHEAFYIHPENIERGLWFGDLNGDRRIETLFNYRPAESRSLGTAVYCFSQSGEPLWHFVPGKPISDREKQFSPLYFVSGFKVLPATANFGNRVVVSSNHSWGYPNQVAVLNSDGKLLEQYWHSGHLLFMAMADIDSDGRSELLLVGHNQGYRKGTLVVLDPDNLAGASVQPEADPYQLQGLQPAKEKAIVLFPRTCINQKFEEYSPAYQLAVTPTSIEVTVSATLSGTTGQYVLYQLTPDLKVISIDVSAQFLNRHRELEAAGRLDHAFSDKERAALEKITVIRK